MGAHHFAGFERRPGERTQNLFGLEAGYERRGRGLAQTCRAVEGAGIAPALERVQQRQMPVRHGAGLVAGDPGMDGNGHALHEGGEVEVARGVVDRVGVEDEQRADVPASMSAARDARDSMCGLSEVTGAM
jgi:hypothetical protein